MNGVKKWPNQIIGANNVKLTMFLQSFGTKRRFNSSTVKGIQAVHMTSC